MHTSTPPRGRIVVNIKSVTDETALLSVTLLLCTDINMNQYINLSIYICICICIYIYIYIKLYLLSEVSQSSDMLN